MNVRLFTALLVVLFVSTCNTSEDLRNGHFHVYRNLPEGRADADNLYGIFELKDDTIINGLYQNKVLSSMGRYDGESNKIYLPDGHGTEAYDLVKEDGGYILRSKGNIDLVLKHFDFAFDHQRNDFFAEHKVFTALKKEPSVRSLEPPMNTLFDVHFGPAKQDFEAAYPCRINMELGNKVCSFMSVDNLELYREQSLIKMPERLRSKVLPLIYCDSSLTDVVMPVVSNYYSSIGIDSFYVAFEPKGKSDSFTILYTLVPTEPYVGHYFKNMNSFLSFLMEDGVHFTSSRYSGEEKTPLDSNMNAGTYDVFLLEHRHNRLYTLDVDFAGDFKNWRASQPDQIVTSVKILQSGIRIWNGLEVGRKVSDLEYLCFDWKGESTASIVYEEDGSLSSYLRIDVKVDEAGDIESFTISRLKS